MNLNITAVATATSDRGTSDWGERSMMTETELQLAIYVEGILRTRGYADVANTVANVVEIEAERHARMMQPRMDLLDAC